MLVSDVMTRGVVSVGLDDTLKSVSELFASHHFHHALVLDEERHLVGVVSDRDILRALSPFVAKLSERSIDAQTLGRPVHQLMKRHPVTISPHETIESAAATMLRKVVSCLPVVDVYGNILGIVTSRDLLRVLSAYPPRSIQSPSHAPTERPSVPLHSASVQPGAAPHPSARLSTPPTG